jgi:hypothetical protein
MCQMLLALDYLQAAKVGLGAYTEASDLDTVWQQALPDVISTADADQAHYTQLLVLRR